MEESMQLTEKAIRYVQASLALFITSNGFYPCDCTKEKKCNGANYRNYPLETVHRWYSEWCAKENQPTCSFDDFFLDIQRMGFTVYGGGNAITYGMTWGTHMLHGRPYKIDLYE